MALNHWQFVVSGDNPQHGESHEVLVSIVICSHNSTDTFDGAVYCVLIRDCPPEEYEVILVDDGATEATVVLA